LPSTKILEVKQKMLNELAEKIKNSTSGVLVDYCGITVEKDTKLRAELRKAGVEYTVVKNTYIKKAADLAGINGFDHVLEGMTALAISEDPIAPSKVLYNFAKDNDYFKIKAGYIDGKVISAAEVKDLAEIPSKEGLICKVLGSLQSSLYGFAYVLQAKIDKEGGVPSTEA